MPSAPTRAASKSNSARVSDTGCGDTVGKIAAEADVKKLALTHHRPRTEDAMLNALLEDVRRDNTGPIVLGEDLTRVVV